jgi:glycosyltransferase involved in cell wall biosynthesis
MDVSIITPVLNAKSYIKANIENVADQGVEQLEHIIVDGGSTDGTLEEIQSLSVHFPHLRIIRGPDRGQSDAMNKGIRAAHGKVIGILNADDFYERGAIANGLQHLLCLNVPTLVAGNCRVIDENNDTVFWSRPNDLRLESLLLGHQFPINPSSYFYHRSIHDIIGCYLIDDHFSMDFDFIMACAEKVNLVYVDAHWGNFRLIPRCKTFIDWKENGSLRGDTIKQKYASRLSPRAKLRFKTKRLLQLTRRFVEIASAGDHTALRDALKRRLRKVREKTSNANCAEKT